MNQRRRLLAVDPKQQKILRDLARMDAWVLACLDILEQQHLTFADTSPLYKSLKQVRFEIYRAGCEVLGVEYALDRYPDNKEKQKPR